MDESEERETANLEYVHRANGFVAQATYRIGKDALTIEKGDGEVSVPFENIKTIQQTFSPTRWQRNRFQTTLSLHKGAPIVFTSSSYSGFASFENQGNQYRIFVIKLHEALASAGVDVSCSTGVSRSKYIGYWLICLFVAVGLGVVSIVFFTVGLRWLIFVKVLFILFYLPVLVRFMRRAKPAIYPLNEVSTVALPEPVAD